MLVEKRRRSAVSTALIGGIVVIVLVAAVAGYYLLAMQSSGPTTTSTPASTTSSPTSSSSSTSAVSSTTSSTSSTTAAGGFDFGLTAAPGNIVLSPGSNLFYPTLNLAPASSATGSESVALNATLPTGFSISYESNPVKISSGVTRSNAMTFNVGQSVAPGDYKVTITGKSGSFTESTTFTIHVVKYLILEQGNAFSPSSLSVPTGSTVYWLNTDAPSGGDAEIHNVIFTSGASSTGPDMHQYDSYSYTFASAGTYNYFCSYHPASMHATITVTG